MSHIAKFVCWHCRKGVVVELNCAPQFAFEVAHLATKAGMLGVIDQRYSRALVFCNGVCAKEEMTKAGHFRLRPKGLKIQPEPTHDR